MHAIGIESSSANDFDPALPPSPTPPCNAAMCADRPFRLRNIPHIAPSIVPTSARFLQTPSPRPALCMIRAREPSSAASVQPETPALPSPAGTALPFPALFDVALDIAAMLLLLPQTHPTTTPLALP